VVVGEREEAMMIRFRWKVLGGHVHVRVFMGTDADHLGKNGDLTFRIEEWKAFIDGIVSTNLLTVSFVEDGA
jgi:hypothetical protein